MTSEDEWYKAAYQQPASQGGDADNYWLYPTSSNSAPTAAQANFDFAVNDTTPVGTYPANHYGTFDMAGNVFEWNEATIFGVFRGLRGGWFGSPDSELRSNVRTEFASTPGNEGLLIGFRVSRLPQPCLADFNSDGGVDADDIIAFFASWDAGEIAADFNGDGGVDSDDVIAFFTRWDSGC